MPEFKLGIAGYTAAVECLFDSTRDYCRAYLSEEQAEVTLQVCREELQQEQDALDAEADREGLRRRKFSEPFLERTVIQRKMADWLFDRDVLMLHGSTVAVDGTAYLFTAKCGTGKSTHTRLWRQEFGDRAVMVNDDKPFLKFAGQTILACGSPWSGKHGLDSNVMLPLGGICILERGKEDRIWRIGPEDGEEMLLQQCFCPEGRETECRSRLAAVMEKTPLWKMQCTKEPTAARVAYQAMAWKADGEAEQN